MPSWVTRTREENEPEETVRVAARSPTSRNSVTLTVKRPSPEPAEGETVHQLLSEETDQAIVEKTITSACPPFHSKPSWSGSASNKVLPFCVTAQDKQAPSSSQKAMTPVLSRSVSLAAALK